MRYRHVAKLLGVALISIAATACSFDGVNSIPLPGNTAGSDTYRVVVDLADAQNLVGNSPVKAGNVTVGNIRKVETNGWHARAQLDIDSDKQIPANVHAALAQTSLFGSQYIELAVPEGEGPQGKLDDGSHIAVADTSQYPPVEKVLSSLSLVLNGSGLQQLRTITDQTDQILNGHEQNARQLLGRSQHLRLRYQQTARRYRERHRIDGLTELEAIWTGGDHHARNRHDRTGDRSAQRAGEEPDDDARLDRVVRRFCHRCAQP